MKIFVATPSYDGNYCGNFMLSFLQLMLNAKSRGHEIMFTQLWHESLVTRARDRLLRAFLVTDADCIAWIDSDIGFNADDIFRMCESKEKFVVGRYPKKGDPKKPLEYVMSDSNGEPNDEGLLPVHYAGTGFMVWKREVAERLVELVKLHPYRVDSRNKEIFYPVFRTPVADGILLSEDYCVCMDWINLGEKVYLDPKVVTTHKGSYVWGT